MIDADYQMAQQMQAGKQEKLSIKEKSKLFVQLLEARKKHFAAMRAQEKMNKPPTKAQKRNTMYTYLKNMAGYKNNQLKNKSFDDIQKLLDKAMKRVNTFVDMETELVEGSEQKVDEDKETPSPTSFSSTNLAMLFNAETYGESLVLGKSPLSEGGDSVEDEFMTAYIEESPDMSRVTLSHYTYLALGREDTCNVCIRSSPYITMTTLVVGLDNGGYLGEWVWS
ncbi:hypothetical protein Tco_0438370 [Tanacetum coccineum]